MNSLQRGFQKPNLGIEEKLLCIRKKKRDREMKLQSLKYLYARERGFETESARSNSFNYAKEITKIYFSKIE